ncbi:MAG TPA: MBL fold metallo-hydrolase [Desulfomicrobium sp.]|nr:MBL fold metallo-hydrolase [Desulfomicrobium sp.]
MTRAELTVLVDNRAGFGCVEEHGYALWIDAGDRRILLDTGQSPALAENARALGVDLGRTDILALSHGHYDHTGAVPLVLSSAPHARLYCHSGVTEPRYSIRDGEARDIRMPMASMRALNALAVDRLRWNGESVPLGGGMGLSGFIPRRTDFEDTGGPFFFDPRGHRPDPINDDQSLWIATDKGLEVCTGCCHAGLVNTLMHLREVTGEGRIRAVIGGLHLGAATPERLEKTARALRDMRVGLLVPCHCTGEAAAAWLADHLDCEVHTGYSGFRLDTADL